MQNGLYASAEGAAAQARRMEVISHNLANVDTPGFKRQLAVLQARHTEAILQGLDQEGSGSRNDIGGGVEIAETETDFGQGTLRQTGSPTDLAIEGNGFFVIDGGDSQRLLTRAGNFQLNSEGILVTQTGRPVLSQESTPIELAPGLPWSVGEDGVITQGASRIPLAVVEPAHMADLVHQGDNMFRAISSTTPVAASQRSVRSGYLELSSVKPATEMMEMIEASRAFESNVRLIQSQDQMVGQLLSRVLRQS